MMKTRFHIIIILFSGILFLRGCDRDVKEMLVSTGSVTGITTTSAVVSGEILDLGEGASQHGHCYSTSPNPVVSGSKTELGIPVLGSYSSSITGLVPQAKYYVRAYLSRGKEVVYGNETEFTTASAALPEITTAEVTGITRNQAVGGGNVTDQGGTPVTARGICWSTATITTLTANKTVDGEGTGIFVSDITGLTSGVTYYVRAYATNSGGTKLGNEVTFTTSTESAVPVVTTVVATSVTGNSAVSGGDVTDDGGSSVSAKGVCWRPNEPNPNIQQHSKTVDGTGSGSFVSNLLSLNPGTTYYYRAYATNGVGTAYGAEYSFTTPALTPALTTIAVNEITHNSAKSGGDITSDGGANITMKGICWNTSPNPTIANTRTNDGVGPAVYVSSMTSLNPNTNYWLKAYATNNAGTGYGNELSFATLPVITTAAMSSVTTTTAACGGSIEAGGGADITARGVCWSTNPNPTTANSTTTDATGTGTFVSTLTGLTPNTNYYLRAYSINAGGIAYGEQRSFTTLAEVSTEAVSSVALVTASGGGTIAAGGGAPVTARGVCWNTSAGPTTSNYKTTDATGTGSFVSSLTGLTSNTKYYVRAYATNAGGTSYGEELVFTTMPSVTTASISDITTNSALGGGTVAAGGGAEITARGVCWSTSSNPTTTDDITTDGTGTGTFPSSITGLTSDRTYYVRAYATNTTGTSYGNEQTFSTLCQAPTAITGTVVILSNTSVRLTGTVNANNSSTVVIFDYGTTESYGGTITAAQSPVTGTTNTSVTAELTGLPTGRLLFYRVRAISCGGTIGGSKQTFITLDCPEYMTVNHVVGDVAPVNKTVTYAVGKIVTNPEFKCWITQNLGAAQQPVSINDITEASAGWYWQFNRKQGYKHDGTIRIPVTTWIATIAETSNWLPANDPCALLLGSGWRVPTGTELTNLNNFGWATFDSDLKLHKAGYLNSTNGALTGRAFLSNNGRYWSGTGSTFPNNSVAGYFNFDNSSVTTIDKSNGFTIRCIKD